MATVFRSVHYPWLLERRDVRFDPHGADKFTISKFEAFSAAFGQVFGCALGERRVAGPFPAWYGERLRCPERAQGGEAQVGGRRWCRTRRQGSFPTLCKRQDMEIFARTTSVIFAALLRRLRPQSSTPSSTPRHRRIQSSGRFHTLQWRLRLRLASVWLLPPSSCVDPSSQQPLPVD